MKTIFLVLAISITITTPAQTIKAQNIFIITTDGLRWQEVFKGADSSIINNPAFVADTSLVKQMYWDVAPEERRKKLMPFFWNVIAKQGQLYGNRVIENKVNVKNIYKISYPGYNEMLTGYADAKPMLNYPLYNSNINILEYLNAQPDYAGKVVAFSSWNLFPYILNTKRNKLLVNSGYKRILKPDNVEGVAINEVQENIKDKTHTRYDLLTFLNAKQYIKEHHPRVVMLSLGETDEFAHHGKYDLYLQQISNVDKMIAELWYLVQTDPQYKKNTVFFITTDHGRGAKPATWYTHNFLTTGSGEIWLALIGKNISSMGEMSNHQQVYQNQFTATIANLLGQTFTSNEPIGKTMSVPAQSIENTLITTSVTPTGLK